MKAYSVGALIHVGDQQGTQRLSLQQMIETRRYSAGVAPLYHLVEYAHDLRIPNKVFRSPIIKELEALGMDMVALSVLPSSTRLRLLTAPAPMTCCHIGRKRCAAAPPRTLGSVPFV